MTQEDFGVELFGAIVACSKTQQVLRMIAAEVAKHHDASELSAEYSRLKEAAKVAVQDPAIHDQDAARLLREYPWLGN